MQENAYKFILCINSLMNAKQKLKEQTSLTVNGIAGFFEGKVTPIGNGAKIGCPKEYVGRRVYVIVLKE